ncbi:MAG: MMPL family transporter [Chloroflexota bacterium]|nr:MMPL family transporter [Chloroflexota bacterium]
MFITWGRFVFRHRWGVLIASLIALLVAVPLAGKANGALISGGWFNRNAESSQVQDEAAARFAQGKSSLIVIYTANDGKKATDAAVAQAVVQSLSPLKSDPRVAGVVTFAETRDARFVSTDGTKQYAVINLVADDDGATDQVVSLQNNIHTNARVQGLTAQVTGTPAISKTISEVSQKDLERSESVTLPITLLILFLVFGSLIAAFLPLTVAAFAIMSSLAGVFIIAHVTAMSIFVVNIITMLGLALAIDYSLFIVNRYKEELRAGNDREAAISRTLATAGKAVVVSGVTVAIGLSSLMLFPFPALRSMGMGGALLVLLSLLFAMTALPAILSLLGTRVNRLALRRTVNPNAGKGWARLAHGVMRHPVLVIVPVLALLIGVGLPFFHVNLANSSPTTLLPAGYESRDAYASLRNDFPRGETAPTVVLLKDTTGGNPLAPEKVPALVDYTSRLAAIPNVGRVDGPTTWQPNLSVAQWQAFYGSPQAKDPKVQPVIGQFVQGDMVRINVVTPAEVTSDTAQRIVRAVRATPAPAGMTVQVGGTAAQEIDIVHDIRATAPYAILIVMLVTMVVLFLTFGSVFLPIKAAFVSLLSLTASYGALVWIFQDGHGANLLNFTVDGTTSATTPIFMFAILFGLSMDYEVLMLSRIQEEYQKTGDNRESIATGLAATARVITGAASIMVVVFGGFALADVVFIKSIGVGLAIAVAVDATIVRVLLVPAVMRLMGKWNWWAPKFVTPLIRHLGLSESAAPQPAASRPYADRAGNAAPVRAEAESD